MQRGFAKDLSQQQILGRVPGHDQISSPVFGIGHQFANWVTGHKVGFDPTAVSLKITLNGF
jgi:hypothetical protein